MRTPRRGRRRPSYRWKAVAALVSALVLAAAALIGGPPGSAPSVQAANGPKAYVGLFKENAVAVLDTATNTVVSKIAVPTGPHGLAATPDGRKVYVASDGTA